MLAAEHLPLIQSHFTESHVMVDTGDVIKAGNLAIPLRPEPAWDLMAQLPVDVGTLGNRETHVLESAFDAKLAGHKHPILCANLHRKDGSDVLPSSLILEREGVKIGFFGVSVAMVTEKMSTRFASAFLWDDPMKTAQRCVDELRGQVDILVALTHIGIAKDRDLVAKVPGIDILFGGHSHTVLESPERTGETWIVQGGSHGRFVGVYDYEVATKTLSGGLHPLRASS